MANLIPKDDYTVERSWHQEGDRYFPCIAIAFKEKREGESRWHRVLSDRGEFRNSDAAQKAAECVEVDGVFDNRIIKFLPPST